MKRLAIVILLIFFAFSLSAANYDGILNGANASANVSWTIDESNLSFTSVVFSNDDGGLSPLGDSFVIKEFKPDLENKKITANKTFYVVWSIFTNDRVSVAMKFEQESNSLVTTGISAKYKNDEKVNITSDEETIYTHESSENTSLDKGYATINISVSADADGLSFGTDGINLGTLTVTVKTDGGAN
ncbi:MAG TPA: hypothetical protein IAB12_00960 [Candidatus Ornithospirochaeta avicola]|uniref:Uncharacterized protein n=1 Tax=Candidatus Ornithospirochaeta avicola TaxID=2840896 RepID=A0A9D1PSZ0_9SPIO|nr:hypothetical protein [Candidatus Ornithospirochaeta avicola]